MTDQRQPISQNERKHKNEKQRQSEHWDSNPRLGFTAQASSLSGRCSGVPAKEFLVICLPPFGDLSWLFVHVQSEHPESNRSLRLRTCALPLSYVPMIGSQRQLTARLKRGFPSKTFLNAAAPRIRTQNLMLTKHLLCQLSYDGKFGSQRSETDCLCVGGYKNVSLANMCRESRWPVCLWLQDTL